MNILICQYQGAKEWLAQQGIAIDKEVSSLELVDVSPGDRVYGHVPLSLLRELGKKQVHYWDILADIHAEVDPATVDVEYLHRINATLIKTDVHRSMGDTLRQWLRGLRYKRQQFGVWYQRRERSPKLIWLYTTMSLLCFAWFGDLLGGSHLFQWAIGHEPAIHDLDLLPTLVSFCGYVLFSSLLIRAGRGLLPGLRSVKVTKTSKASRVLLLNLSPLWQLSKHNKTFSVALRARDTVTHYEFQGDLSADLEALTALEEKELFWNGTQLLRALNTHISQVETVVLLSTKDLGSKRNELGSHSYAPIVKSLLSLFVDPYRCKIVVEPRLLHPQNVGETYDTINEILNDLIAKEHVRDRDICLDITGGTAPMSCAAAMVTIHRNSQFQYVSTDGKGEVVQQDLQLTVSPAKL